MSCPNKERPEFKNQAISDFTRAIKLDPSNGMHYYSRATVYHALRMPEKALPDYQKAVELNHNVEESSIYMVHCLLHIEKYQEAYDMCEDIISKTKSPEAYYWKSNAGIRLELYQDAIIDAVLAIEGGHKQTEQLYTNIEVAYQLLDKSKQEIDEIIKDIKSKYNHT